ncbi:hypothetical protein GC173_05825 [bacterium]|nr:hypothetical protein [bacterium]
MRTSWTIRAWVLAVATSLIIIPAVGTCQDEAPAEGGRRGRGNFDPAQMFARMDANGDGTIEKSEFRGPEDRFGDLDKDKDGKVTKAEFDEARASWGNRREGGRGPGGPGGFGGLNAEAIIEKLGLSTEESAVLKPRIEKLVTMVNSARPGRNNQMPEMEALRTTVESADSTPEQISKAVADLRKAREARAAELKTAREELRELLTPKQEAILIVDGLLD